MSYGLETWDSTGKQQLKLDGRVAKVISIQTANATFANVLGAQNITMTAIGMLNDSTREAIVIEPINGIFTVVGKGVDSITLHCPDGSPLAYRNTPVTIIVIGI